MKENSELTNCDLKEIAEDFGKKIEEGLEHNDGREIKCIPTYILSAMIIVSAITN